MVSPLTLGRLRLDSPFILAPMEGVSDAAFRRLCHEQGAALTFTEMIRARPLAQGNASTLSLIDVEPDVPSGIQLLASTERELMDALLSLDERARTTHPHFRHLRAVDLNFGCPSPDVIDAGAGPALLKRPARLRALFRALRDWVQRTELPVHAVGAKIRLGLNRREQDEKVFLKVVDAAGEHLDYLVIHARHARQQSVDPPTWAAIGEARRRARIPIIGNGDVVTPEDFARLVQTTGADGAMIARGAIRSPWVFRALVGKGAGVPTVAELELAERTYFERARSLGTKDKYLTWHTEGFRRMRARLAGREPQGPSFPKNEHVQ